MITFLSGGTGTPKLISGFRDIIKDENIGVIANTADNIWIYGLYVAPDVDTVMYLFAGLLDTNKYWGIKDDTFHTMNMLQTLNYENWFNLGDKDLAIHLLRTVAIREGKTLSQITRDLCNLLNIKAKIIPATDNHIETRIITKISEDLHFQEFWVKYRGQKEIEKVYIKFIENAVVPKDALNLLNQSEIIIIGPSNPITSIGPMIKLPELRKTLEKNKEKCVAISPMIGSEPVSGPAGKLMRSEKIETTAFGVAQIYSDLIDVLFIHNTDDAMKNRIESEFGIRVIADNILFKKRSDASVLAKKILEVMKN